MRICIPPVPLRGGSGTFHRNWQAWLTQQGISWTHDLEHHYDILFVNSWQIKYMQVYRHKQRLPQLRVVHRIDGAGKDYGRTDGIDARQLAINTLADHTIYQSEYSRWTTLEKYRVTQHNGPVIYNPVDTDHFSPQGEGLPKLAISHTKPRILSAIWSPNRRKGAWRIPILARANPDLHFIYIGSQTFEAPPPNLQLFSAMDHHDLAKAMRSADVYLNLSERDPCPNVVLEAMASGLPVLFVPSGGTLELVNEASGLPFATEAEFRPQLERLLAGLDRYQQGARRHVEANFAPHIIFQQYIEAIHNTRRRAMPSRIRHWFSRAQMMRVWIQDKLVNYENWMAELR